MRVDRDLFTDPLVDSDPWAATPLANARPADGTSQNWPGWPTDTDLLQMDLPQFQTAPAKAQ
eukprot:5595671-Karenia_brevis.AAC.1